VASAQANAPNVTWPFVCTVANGCNRNSAPMSQEQVSINQ